MSKLMSFTGTALKNLFSTPATTAYPFVPKNYPERTRGHIEIDINECIMCGLCMRSCPPGAIQVNKAENTWTIQRFDCIQCGYCVDKCPKKCLKIVPGYTKPQQVKEAEVVVKPKKDISDSAAMKSVQENGSEGKQDSKTVSSNSETNLPKADLEVCVFCTLCAKKCPQEALMVDRAEKTWKLDEEKCISCGLCTDCCPKKCISM